MLRNLDKLIAIETGMDVFVAENPIDCVAKGIATRLDMPNNFGGYIYSRR